MLLTGGTQQDLYQLAIIKIRPLKKKKYPSTSLLKAICRRQGGEGVELLTPNNFCHLHISPGRKSSLTCRRYRNIMCGPRAHSIILPPSPSATHANTSAYLFNSMEWTFCACQGVRRYMVQNTVLENESAKITNQK